MGIHDYSNQIADEHINKLYENKINYLDLRESIKKQNINHYDLFFFSDHHWKQESALWASQEISKYIKETFLLDKDLSLLNKDNYSKLTYTNYFLGDDWPLLSINNKSNNNKCNKKILIIKDSFSNTYAPFLAIIFDKIDLIDLRYFNGSLKAYIEKTKPDIVMICYNVSMITRLKAIWDFD